jgi:hypothetical protein
VLNKVRGLIFFNDRHPNGRTTPSPFIPFSLHVFVLLHLQHNKNDNNNNKVHPYCLFDSEETLNIIHHAYELSLAIASSSDADPGCLSRILDPDFDPSRFRVSDPGSSNSNKRGVKIFCLTFFVAINFLQNCKLFFLNIFRKEFDKEL